MTSRATPAPDDRRNELRPSRGDDEGEALLGKVGGAVAGALRR